MVLVIHHLQPNPGRSINEERLHRLLPDLGLRSIGISADIDRSIDVIGDSQAVRQILINLLAEAARNAQNGAALSISTACTRDAVSLSVGVAADHITAAADEESFTMVLARTLCELSGAELTFTIGDDGGRTWTVDFLPVAQNDLFGAR